MEYNDINFTLEEINGKYLSKAEQRCLAFIVTCLLPGSSTNVVLDEQFSWNRHFLSLFIDHLPDLNSKAIHGMIPLLGQHQDPKPFITQCNWESQRTRILALLIVLQFGILQFQCLDSRTVQLVRSLAHVLDVPLIALTKHHDAYGDQMLATIKEVNNKQKNGTSKTLLTYAGIGVAGIGAGAALFFSAGAAAPLIGAGFAALGFGATTTVAVFLTSAAGITTISALFGGGGAALVGYKMNRRVSGLDEFAFRSFLFSTGMEEHEEIDSKSTNIPEEKHLEIRNENKLSQRDSSVKQENQTHMKVLLCINGWLLDENDADSHWNSAVKIHGNDYEAFILLWESQWLKRLGVGLKSFIQKEAVSTSLAYVGMQTSAAALLSALTWPVALLGTAEIIDNPWSMVMSRADKGALLLADVIEQRLYGRRPLTLIGFGPGARLIFLALEELARRERQDSTSLENSSSSDEVNNERNISKSSESDAPELKSVSRRGAVLDVLLLGAPISGLYERWKQVKTVVAGRLINCYIPKDLVLRFLYRTTNMTVSVAGLGPVVEQTASGSNSAQNESESQVTNKENDIKSEILNKPNIFRGSIENYDVTEIVSSHAQYYHKIEEVCKHINLSLQTETNDQQFEVNEL